MSEIKAQVYYSYDKEEDEIALGEKKYTDMFDQYPDGANGYEGVPYKEDEPYNWFAEINNAMWDIDCPEEAEGLFNTNGYSLDYIKSKMKEKGFELIEDPNKTNKNRG